MKHYRDKLVGYANDELGIAEGRAVADHLRDCADCRSEYETISFAAGLAAKLGGEDPPGVVWHRIEAALDERPVWPSLFLRPAFLAAAAVLSVAATAGLLAVLRSGPDGRGTPAIVTAPVPRPSVGTLAERLADEPRSAPAGDYPIEKEAVRVSPGGTDKNGPRRNVTAPGPLIVQWRVDAIEGNPRVGSSFGATTIPVGEYLETDAFSRARIQVADIGDVEIAPKSRVRFVNSRPTEHRLSLERGLLTAKIFAPPRLFIVDTPSAAAVDLGCEYTLEVDDGGNSRLHVTSGFVALERDGQESIVPAGAIAYSRKGGAIGMPFAEEAGDAMREAVREFDFEGGGSRAAAEIVGLATRDDSITLWHLLTRVDPADRVAVFEKLASVVPLPRRTNRAGILRLDRRMLALWREEIEIDWFLR